MFRLSILLWCITSLVSVVHATDMVVVRSNITQSFPKGKLLDQNTPITLPAEAEITVIFVSGAVKTVTGPYHGILTEPLPNQEVEPLDINTLAKFLAQRTGTVRGTSPLLQQKPQDLWWVDVYRQERFYCVTPASNVTLWRPDEQSITASRLIIKRKTTDEQAEIDWPAYQTTLEWPLEELPVIYEETYTVTVKNPSGSSFRKLILYQLPENLPTESHKVVWMVSRRCIGQAYMLLANLR